MNILKVLLPLYCLLSQGFSIAQKNSSNLDSLYSEIELLIGDEWYLERTKKGFQVTFCRSCADAYNYYVENVDIFERRKARSDFFTQEKIDSVSYFTTVSNTPVSPNLSKEERIEYFTDFYKPSHLLRFNITIEQLWSKEHFDRIIAQNNILRERILNEPIYKTSKDIFSDYRFWIPGKYWKSRTQDLDFYFERIPYSSVTMDNSIFIEHNKPHFFSEPMLVDKNDRTFFEKSRNLLEDERRRTLKIIALALGIHDYKIIN